MGATVPETTAHCRGPRPMKRSASTVGHADASPQPKHLRAAPAQGDPAVQCTLNVGGVRYLTSRNTLCNTSNFFGAMFHNFSESGMSDIFIDRDGAVFEHVLSYMRSHSVTLPPQDEQLLRALLVEAQYYQIDGLLDLLKPKLIRRLHPGRHFVSDSQALEWCNQNFGTLSELLHCELPWVLGSVTHHTQTLVVRIYGYTSEGEADSEPLGTFDCPCSAILSKASGEQLVSPLCLVPHNPGSDEPSALHSAFAERSLDLATVVSRFGELYCVQQIASALGMTYSVSNGSTEKVHVITQHNLVAQYADGESYWNKPVDLLQVITDGGKIRSCKAFDFDNYAGPKVSLQPLNRQTQALQGFSSTHADTYTHNDV